jgi:hypothetical protein
MAELLVAFPKSERAELSGPLSDAVRYVEEVGLGSDPRTETASGASVFVTSSPAHAPSLYCAPAGAGWIAVKGIIFDVCSRKPRVDLEALWRRFASGDPVDWNRYEGTFALAAWDALRRRGVALNDQTSQLNFYYCEDAGFVYAATSALALARALGRGLDPASAREFLARGALVTPSAMFGGLRRLNVGERLDIDGGRATLARHWYYPPDPAKWSFDRAAEEAAGVSADRIARYAAAGGRPVMDLTSGYDSRLLASAADHAGLHPTVTVNGVPGDEEVRIARRVAEAAGWPIRFFDRREVSTRIIDAEARRHLQWRVDGNLVFTAVYHNWLTRPLLAEEFRMHTAGVGGEFIRYHPWGQEFFGIGRRRPAKIDSILKYRMLQGAPPPRDLFDDDWYAQFYRELHARVEQLCGELPGSLTTQQLDAVHVWKQTGHPSLYLSALFNWLPATVPSMGSGFVSVGMMTPWRYRVTVRLTRRVIEMLCPAAAEVVTRYGGTAGPVRLSNIHLHASQPFKRLGHLAQKLDHVWLGGVLTARKAPPNAVVPVPWITEELRSMLSPDTMQSRAIYARDGLRRLLSGDDEAWRAKERLILRVATLEQLCRELDFTPEAGFIHSVEA